MESRSIRVSSAMAYLRRLDVYRMASAIARGRSRTYTPAGASSAVTPAAAAGCVPSPGRGRALTASDEPSYNQAPWSRSGSTRRQAAVVFARAPVVRDDAGDVFDVITA